MILRRALYWRLQLQLLLAASLCTSAISSVATENDSVFYSERPKMFVDYVRGPLKGEVYHFPGNTTTVDNFKVMEADGNFLIVGATNLVYFLDTRTMDEAKELRIVWFPSEGESDMCILKGRSKVECQNHIRIVAKMEKNKLLICGTHAYRPKCRHYVFQDGHYVSEKEFGGVGMVPFDPYHNSTFVLADGELYSATVSDFSASDPLIYKEPLRTEQSDSKHLNSPDFVRGLEDGDYVYFFFREQAVEYINCGKSVYSRVARVCKSDKGGPNKYRHSWTSFLKSRLNCSLPGEYPFYFDHLQSASEIVQGEYGGQSSRLVYAVFTTPKNSISGNAICAFRLRDLLDTFEGAFKEQETANSNWLPVPKIKEPNPRPGRCSADSKDLPETTLSFVKGHSIMDEAVPSFFGGRPIFIKADLERPTEFRELTVDGQVRTPDGQTYDVIFVGTTNGRILKIVNTADPTNARASKPTLVEEMVVFPPNVVIEKLQVVRNSLEREPKLVALTADDVVALPLARCAAAKTCRSCVALQDPYCAWDSNRGFCASLHEYQEKDDSVDSISFVQNVISGKHSQCGLTSAEEVAEEEEEAERKAESQEEPSSSKVLLDRTDTPLDEDDMILIPSGPASDPLNGQYSTEELSMAVATSCVCALVLGFISGFLMAKRCSCSREAEENPYHVPYLNQSGYQDDQIYAKVDDMTYYPVNSMLVSLPNTNSTSSSSGGRGGGGADSGSGTGAPPALPSLPPGALSSGSKTLSLHHGQHSSSSGVLSGPANGGSTNNPRAGDFHASFGTVHRSQKIYL